MHAYKCMHINLFQLWAVHLEFDCGRVSKEPALKAVNWLRQGGGLEISKTNKWNKEAGQIKITCFAEMLCWLFQLLSDYFFNTIFCPTGSTRSLEIKMDSNHDWILAHLHGNKLHWKQRLLPLSAENVKRRNLHQVQCCWSWVLGFLMYLLQWTWKLQLKWGKVFWQMLMLGPSLQKCILNVRKKRGHNTEKCYVNLSQLFYGSPPNPTC